MPFGKHFPHLHPGQVRYDRRVSDNFTIGSGLPTASKAFCEENRRGFFSAYSTYSLEVTLPLEGVASSPMLTLRQDSHRQAASA